MSFDDMDIFPKKVGRPHASDLQAQRKKHIEAALIYFCTELPLSRIRLVYGVSEKTVKRWIFRALTYDEADSIRILAKAFRKRIKLPQNREYL